MVPVHPAHGADQAQLVEAIGDGSQVHDKVTNLIWMRCIGDQSWNGSTCIAKDPEAVNPGPRLTDQQAKALAAGTSTTDERWRVAGVGHWHP